MESAYSSTRKVLALKLRTAASEEDVVRLVREFIAEWRPEDLAQVPEVCRPAKIRDGEDIADCAFNLTRARMEGSNDGSSHLLAEMESFFAQACVRLSELEGTATRGRGRDDSESESA